MKKFISTVLILVIAVSVAVTGIIKSTALSTDEELDYSRFEAEYLMNILEHDGTTINGSVDVYDKVINDNFFHHDFSEYLSSHPILKQLTIDQVKVFNDDIDLKSNPEYFYSLVLMDILQSKELKEVNCDALKSTIESDLLEILKLTFQHLTLDTLELYKIKNISDLKNKVVKDLPDNAFITLADKLLESTSKHVNFGDANAIWNYLNACQNRTVGDAINRIDSLCTAAEYNKKTIDALLIVYYKTQNPYIKLAIEDIVDIYCAADSPEEIEAIMSDGGYNITSYNVENLCFQTTKFVATTLFDKTVGRICDVWDFGIKFANLFFDVSDLNTGYLIVSAATDIEDELRRYLSSCCNNYLLSRSVDYATKCRHAYRLILTTQYYANDIMQALGASLASYDSAWGTVRALFGCTDYQDVVDVCNSTRNIISNRYYKWVGLAEKMYETVYDVNFGHSISVSSTPVSSVSLKYSSYTLFINEGVCNVATAYPSNAVDREIYYSSSDTSVAVVNAYGNISAVGPGVATITARTLNGKFATCQITVLPYSILNVDGGNIISGYYSNETVVNIPASSSTGVPVTAIADEVFKNKSIISATIPDSVTSIGDYAFYNCSGITEVNLSIGLESIGKSAFYGCTGLTEIEVPNSVTEIGEKAFKGCENLKKVTLPFVGRTRDASGEEATFEYIFQGMFMNLTEVIITDATQIGDSAFFDFNLVEKITLNDEITSIGSYAFSFCEKLTEINFPTSLTSIGSNAFACCEKLTKINLPTSLTSIGCYAFEACTGLTEIEVPNSVTEIGQEVFKACENLKKVTLPFVGRTRDASGEEATFEYIFQGMFMNLKEIIITDATQIGDSAFYNFNLVEKITLNDEITSIGSYAFYCNIDLTEINFPTSLISIGNSAFGCCPLKEIKLPKNLISIGKYAFECCDLIGDLVIPNGVKIIDEYAFYYNSNLTNVTLPQSLTSIGQCAFYRCDNLNEITFRSFNCNIYDSANTIPKKAVIYCCPGSTAQAYAEKYSRDFVANHTFENGMCIYCNTLVYELNSVTQIESDINLEGKYFTVFDINGTQLTESDLIGTGAKVYIYDSTTNELLNTYSTVLYGDVNGDGLIDDADKDIIISIATCQATIENEWCLMAADTNHDGAVDAFDVIETELQSLEMHNIEQKNNAEYLPKDEREETTEEDN